MKKCFAIVLVAFLLAGMFSFSAMASTVSKVDVGGIDLPEAGQKPDFTAQSTSTSNSYKITRVEWIEYDEKFDEWERDMTANDTFKEGYWYVVYVYFEALSGNTFSNNVECYVNGIKAHINGNSVQENGTKVSCYTSYKATKQRSAISSISLSVVNPVIGKYPTFAKVDTAQYFSEKYGTVSNCSNGVTWTNQSSGVNLTVNNNFKEGVKYKVSYYLTAKDGFKFNNNTKCTINGYTATVEVNDATHITVSLGDIVPGDGKKEVSSLNLSVTAPKDGEKPDYTKFDGTGYYSDNGLNGTSTKIYKNGIAWYKSTTSYISPGTTETFKGGSEYTLKISLTPKDGYKFGKSLTVKINEKTATVETFDDGSINVSVKLTALSKEHKHTESNWKSDDDGHWKSCTDTACGSVTTAKEAHKDDNNDKKCDICGFEIKTADMQTPNAPRDENPTTSQPETDGDVINDGEISDEESVEDKNNAVETKKETNKKDEDSFPWIWVIIVGAVIVLGAGGALTVIMLKKKSK